MSKTRYHASDPEDLVPLFPGFREMAEGRRRLLGELVSQRRSLGLSQTEVAARMGTSQSAVARLEALAGDARLSTLERYAEAVGHTLRWSLEPASARAGNPSGGDAEVGQR
jgi:transcriptional regulator with XRE-family HTH domain